MTGREICLAVGGLLPLELEKEKKAAIRGQASRKSYGLDFPPSSPEDGGE
jgi:hypothetical protein